MASATGCGASSTVFFFFFDPVLPVLWESVFPQKLGGRLPSSLSLPTTQTAFRVETSVVSKTIFQFNFVQQRPLPPLGRPSNVVHYPLHAFGLSL